MTASWWTSTERLTVPAGGRVRGPVRLPGSKSVTHRALAVALLAEAAVELAGPLDAEDTRHFLRVLASFGAHVERTRERWRITPGTPPASRAELDCGSAGTLLRFLVALAATVPGEWRIDGSARLRERPVGPLAAALAELGARVRWLARPGYAPLVVEGGALAGGRVRLDAGESSQYLSALLLAGQRARGPVEIEVPRLVSAPYVELTAEVLEHFGGRVERPQANLWRARPSALHGGRLAIERDLSAAAYPAAAAALTGGDVVLRDVSLDSRQGDARFLGLLAELGARVSTVPDGVRVCGDRLVAVDADLADLPDQVPTLAALAPFALGVTRIRGVAHLRLKESDRIAAMAAELGRAGVPAEERPDGLVVPGCWAAAPPPATAVETDSHDDHRVAMAMALVGLRRGNVTIRDPQVVAKSWPEYWTELARWLGEPVADAR